MYQKSIFLQKIENNWNESSVNFVVQYEYPWHPTLIDSKSLLTTGEKTLYLFHCGECFRECFSQVVIFLCELFYLCCVPFSVLL